MNYIILGFFFGFWCRSWTDIPNAITTTAAPTTTHKYEILSNSFHMWQEWRVPKPKPTTQREKINKFAGPPHFICDGIRTTYVHLFYLNLNEASPARTVREGIEYGIELFDRQWDTFFFFASTRNGTILMLANAINFWRAFFVLCIFV